MNKRWCVLAVALLALLPALAGAQARSVSIACWDSWYSPVGFAAGSPVWDEIQKRSGVKVTFNIFDDYDTKMNTVIASGSNLPDVFIIPPTWSGSAGVYRLALEKVIQPLDALIASPDGADIRKQLAAMPDIKKLLTAPDGKIYSVTDLPLTGIAPQFQIRNDWLKKLGLAKPETADDWYAVLKAFKDKDPNGNGKADEIPFSDSGDFLTSPFMTAFGLVPESYRANAKGTIVAQFTLDAYRDYLVFLNRLYKDGLMDREKRDEAGLAALEAQSRVGVITDWTDIFTTFEATAKSGGAPDADVLPLPPAHPKGAKQGYYADRAANWNHYGIAATSKNAPAAIKLIDFLWADPEGLRLKEYGIEGTSYTLVNGTPRYTDFIVKNPALSPMDALRSIGGSPSIFVHDLKDAYLAKAVDNPKLAQVYNALGAYLVPPTPDVMALEQESKDLTKLLADIDTYRKEMVMKFITGEAPLAGFAAYVKTLNGMGLDKVVTIKQAQYNRYLGKK
jgi:putative aldouronate transport system substrate-binding protein